MKFDYVKNVSSTIWQAYIWDFANLFRGWLSRIWENEISSRINLISPSKYEEITWKSRKSSEQLTIELRPKLRKFLLEKYPDIKIRLLEDPPGPPVRATFLIKLKWNASKENKEKFLIKTEQEVRKIAKKEEIVDLYNSKSTTYKKLKITLDHQSLSRAWLTAQQVEYTLWIALNWFDTNLIENKNSFEPTNIIIIWKQDKLDNIWTIKNISFTNKQGQKIPLSSIAKIDYSFVSPIINTDKREQTDYIYAEMWDNSLIYPVIKLFGKFMDDEFLWKDYKLVSWSPYEIKYKWLKDWKEYIIEWWWEWELTMDTFRDLWMAMAISLLAIYFVLVWQFASFGIAWVIMITFLLWFFGVWPWFTFLYLVNNEYFSATSMIWVIALAWIVVWNAIILIEYVSVLKQHWLTLKDALLQAWYVRFAPIILTSLTTVFWAATIIWDPVWSWLAWSIIWWLSISSFLTLVIIPVFYYESQKNTWKAEVEKITH
jgi:multidrug efflux pump subunit AcrB